MRPQAVKIRRPLRSTGSVLWLPLEIPYISSDIKFLEGRNFRRKSVGGGPPFARAPPTPKTILPLLGAQDRPKIPQ